MAAEDGSLYTYTKKLYDLREKNHGLSLEQIEGLQILSQTDNSTYAKELKTLMKLDLPRNVVERTAKQFDSFRAPGPVFKFRRTPKKAKYDLESSSSFDGEHN